MELMGLIIFSCGIMILWKYNTDSLWVIALLALTVGLASFFELQKKAPNVFKSLDAELKPPVGAATAARRRPKTDEGQGRHVRSEENQPNC